MNKLKILFISLTLFSVQNGFAPSQSQAGLGDTLSLMASASDLSAALQKYNQQAFPGSTPPVDNGDGTISYRFYLDTSRTSVGRGLCTKNGCQSVGAIDCNPNEVASLDGTCSCVSGYQRTTYGIGLCEKVNQCPAGTTLVGHQITGNACQCDGSSQTIAVGSTDSEPCGAGEDIAGATCPPDPRIADPYATDLAIADWEAACQRQAQAQLINNRTSQAAEARANADAALAAALDQAEQDIITTCSSAVSSFEANCSSLSSGAQGNAPSVSSASSRAQCESSKQTLEASMSAVSSCTSQYNALSSSCPSTTGNISVEGNATVSDGSPQFGDVVVVDGPPVTASGTRPISDNPMGRAIPLYTALTGINSGLAASKAGAEQCIAAFDSGGNPNDGSGVNSYAGPNINDLKGLGGFGGNSGGSSSSFGSELGAAGKAGRYRGEQFSGGSAGSSPNLSKGLGAAVNGITDDKVFQNKDPRTQNTNKSGGPGTAGAYGQGQNTAARLGGGSGGNARVGANAKRRPYKTAKARDLVNGYKNVRASDGGGSLSIRPSAFKKYGSKALKKKIADARKKFGKGMPLIFKNGKFVLDFLAMKNSRQFKARNAAMERRLKGSSERQTASVTELPVHQNEKLNIFKLMNLRYQKQAFSSGL